MSASPGTRYVLEVRPKIPRRLTRLAELADNLWYSWDRPTRYLFAQLNPRLWDAVGHSPKAFLNRVDEQRLVDAVDDQRYMDRFNRVLSAYDTYHGEPHRPEATEQLRQSDLVAYFCAVPIVAFFIPGDPTVIAEGAGFIRIMSRSIPRVRDF